MSFYNHIYYTADIWTDCMQIPSRSYSLKRNSPGNAQEDKWERSSHLHQYTIHWLSKHSHKAQMEKQQDKALVQVQEDVRIKYEPGQE